MTEFLVPATVELKSLARELTVTWSDAHQSTYPLGYLRGFCPCAECQGHKSGWTFIAVANPRITDIQEVGSYALNIVWQDDQRAHTTGIYSFDVLRSLCPCDACTTAQGEAHPLHLMAGHG